jgi:GTP-binding protein
MKPAEKEAYLQSETFQNTLRQIQRRDKIWQGLLRGELTLSGDRAECERLSRLIDRELQEGHKVDLAFLHFLGSNGVPFAIVFTKADKLAPSKVKPAAEKYLDVLREEWEELPPYFITSATSKLGKDELLDYIENINKSL